MTVALKAMVEAMAADLEKQASQPEGGFVREPDGEPGFYLQGTFDLEKAVRAGLAAIHDPGDTVAYSGSWAVGPGGHAAKKAELTKAFGAMIDAILKADPE